MRIISNDDVYVDALSTAALATIPFITIGILNHPIILNVASALGILLGCGCLIRFGINAKRPETIRTNEWVPNLMSFLQLPYVFVISAFILINDRIDATIIVWICLGVAILGGAGSIYFTKHLDDD